MSHFRWNHWKLKYFNQKLYDCADWVVHGSLAEWLEEKKKMSAKHLQQFNQQSLFWNIKRHLFDSDLVHWWTTCMVLIKKVILTNDGLSKKKKSKTKPERVDREERNKWVEEKRWQSRTRERQSCTNTMSFYLAEYDVDYTADHHQSIEDVPGVPDITLNTAACTARGRRGRGG